MITEKPFTTDLIFQSHCEGLFHIKGEYENLWFETKNNRGKVFRVFRLQEIYYTTILKTPLKNYKKRIK